MIYQTIWKNIIPHPLNKLGVENMKKKIKVLFIFISYVSGHYQRLDCLAILDSIDRKPFNFIYKYFLKCTSIKSWLINE